MSPWSSSPLERRARLLQLIRDCTVGTHRVGHAAGQDQFQPVDGRHSNQRIALIDQIEHGSDNERHIERAALYAVGYRARACEFPDRMRTHSISPTFTSTTLRPGQAAR